MFATTPRLRDLLDLRTVVVVLAIALGAFALQLGVLAGTVATPLGGAIADLEREPQVEGAPAEAIARAQDEAGPADGAREAWLAPWDRTAPLAVDHRPAIRECLVYR